MPITQSAKKALRQTERRTLRNLARKNAYRNELKRIAQLLDAKKFAEAERFVPRAYRALDKAAKTGVLQKNTASRRKARLMRWIRAAQTASA